MENLIIDREILEQLADSLIARKYPGEPVENHAELREATIAHLDDYLLDAIFDALPEERLDELNTMIENEQLTSSEDFVAVYKAAGLDFSAIVRQAMDNFSQEFLGGAK